MAIQVTAVPGVQIYIGMLVWLIGTAALFGVKRFAAGSIAMIPLIVLAVIYRVAVRNTFEKPMKVLAIHAAADLDRGDGVRRTARARFLARSHAHTHLVSCPSIAGVHFGPLLA